MTVALKLAAALVFVVGAGLERSGLLRAPGFALVAGALLAVYLWFLASVRRRIRPPR